MTNRDERARNLELREKELVEREGTRPGLVFRPDVDILEHKDAYVVYADVPGADESSVEVRLERGTLTLDARLQTLPEPDWRPLHAEYRFGAYHREFQIPEEIDPDGVTATLRDGVLQLELRKAARHQPRTIQVRAG